MADKPTYDELEQRVHELEMKALEYEGFDEALRRNYRVCSKLLECTRKKAEEVKDLYNNAPCGYHSLDKDGYFIKINDTELSWLGYTRDELVGKKRSVDLMPPDSVEKFKSYYPLFMKNGYVRELEFEFIRKDGTTIPVLLSGSAIYDDAGNYLMSRTTLFDVTLHKKREEEQKQAELEYRTIVKGALDGFVVIDLQSHLFVDVNDTYCGLIGYAREELLNMSIDEIEAVESPEEVADHVEKVIRTGHDRFETRHRCKDGRIVDIEVSANYLDGGGGRVYSFYRDITARKRAEKEVKESREQLRFLAETLQSVRESERKRIARDIHDDLGQALTVLQFYLSQIEEMLTEDQQALLEKTRQAMLLVDDTIDTVQRISSDLRPTLLDNLGITAAIESYAKSFKDRTRIETLTVFHPDKIDIDRALATELFRVFQEAMTNVSRHAKATRVDISLRRVAHKLIMQIADNGKGIKMEEVRDPRYAIGLIGMKERVYPWNGKLHIASDESNGTTVTVVVPVAIERRDK